MIRRPRTHAFEPALASIVEMCVLLIVFLLATTVLTQVDGFDVVPAGPPRVAGTGLQVTLAEGGVWVRRPGASVAYVRATETIAWAEVVALLDADRAAWPEDPSITIAVHDDVGFRWMFRLIDDAQARGYTERRLVVAPP